MDSQFIVLSGIDGSGKSTLMRHLRDYAAHEIARGHEIPHYEAYFTCEDRVKHVFHIGTDADTAWWRKQPEVSRYECGGRDVCYDHFVGQQTQVDQEIRSLIRAYPHTLLPQGQTSQQWRDIVLSILAAGKPA